MDQHGPASTSTGRHGPARTGTNRHQSSPIGTDRHGPARAGTNRHQSAPIGCLTLPLIAAPSAPRNPPWRTRVADLAEDRGKTPSPTQSHAQCQQNDALIARGMLLLARGTPTQEVPAPPRRYRPHPEKTRTHLTTTRPIQPPLINSQLLG